MQSSKFKGPRIPKPPPPPPKPPTAQVNAKPVDTPPWLKITASSVAVAADSNLVAEGFNNFDVDAMAEITLEDIGAVELSTITRYDSLNGQQLAYSPILKKNRMLMYSANNLLGQSNSLLTTNGLNYLNTTKYVDGEINRGYELGTIPPELDMEIQIALTADVVPFSTTGEVFEVI